MTTEEQIRDEMKRIVGANNKNNIVTHPIMSGTVVAASVDTDNNICLVQLAGDDASNPTGGTRLNVIVPSNNMGIIQYPADGANVIIAQIDGSDDNQLIWADQLTKAIITVGGSSLTITDSLIQLNDGSLGGIPVQQKIQDNLNQLQTYITTMQQAISNAFTAVGAGTAASGPNGAASFTSAMAGQTINFDDMQNTKVKHG